MAGHSLPYLANCSLLFTEEPRARTAGAANVAFLCDLYHPAVLDWSPCGS